MPSQRLVKMLDPLGHLRGGSVLMSDTPKAVIWAPQAKLAGWIASALSAAGFAALRATSFRHVSASLMPGAAPQVHLAIVDFDAIAAAEIEALTSARWAGFTGTVIAIAARGSVADRIRAVVGVEAAVEPHSDELANALVHVRRRR
jgi:DNA-binding response OmpR family regulator